MTVLQFFSIGARNLTLNFSTPLYEFEMEHTFLTIILYTHDSIRMISPMIITCQLTFYSRNSVLSRFCDETQNRLFVYRPIGAATIGNFCY